MIYSLINSEFICKFLLVLFVNFAFLFFIGNNQVDVVCIKVNTSKIFYNTFQNILQYNTNVAHFFSPQDYY